jgi:hypothetical protein
MAAKVIVHIIESERGWGQKIDSIEKFDSASEAEEFCKEFNKDNPTDYVPNWYMIARIVGVGE